MGKDNNNSSKSNSFLLHCLSVISGIIFTIMAGFFFYFMIIGVHPGINSETSSSKGTSYELAARIDSITSDSKNNLLKDYLSTDDIIRKIYKIEKGSNVPLPIEEAFGTLKVDEIDQIDAVIDSARECGLLANDQQLAFSKDVQFLSNKTIQYYFDETILVICWKELIDGKVVTFSEVKINDPSQFRRKLTEDTYGSGVKKYCTSLAKSSNAVVAFNADFYAFRNLGITCYDGTIYRTEQSLDILFIDENGDFVFYDRKQTDDKETLQKFVDDNHLQFSLAFGPILIKDGQLLDNTRYPIGEINEIYSRAGIGEIEPLHYLYMTVDNYGESRRPCTVNQFAAFMYSKGVKQGYNLDGGQTGELVFNNKIFNLVDWNNERDVSDIIYFVTALPESERQ